MSVLNPRGFSDKTAGAIAYITFLPAIVFLVLPPYNATPYVRFHSWQSILLNLAALIFDIVLAVVLAFTGAFLPIGIQLIWPLIDLAWLALWLLCVVKAGNGERFKFPMIGALAEQLANK